jgi:hypothetical protein
MSMAAGRRAWMIGSLAQVAALLSSLAASADRPTPVMERDKPALACGLESLQFAAWALGVVIPREELREWGAAHGDPSASMCDLGHLAEHYGVQLVGLSASLEEVVAYRCPAVLWCTPSHFVSIRPMGADLYEVYDGRSRYEDAALLSKHYAGRALVPVSVVGQAERDAWLQVLARVAPSTPIPPEPRAAPLDARDLGVTAVPLLVSDVAPSSQPGSPGWETACPQLGLGVTATDAGTVLVRCPEAGHTAYPASGGAQREVWELDGSRSGVEAVANVMGAATRSGVIAFFGACQPVPLAADTPGLAALRAMVFSEAVPDGLSVRWAPLAGVELGVGPLYARRLDKLCLGDVIVRPDQFPTDLQGATYEVPDDDGGNHLDVADLIDDVRSGVERRGSSLLMVTPRREEMVSIAPGTYCVPDLLFLCGEAVGGRWERCGDLVLLRLPTLPPLPVRDPEGAESGQLTVVRQRVVLVPQELIPYCMESGPWGQGALVLSDASGAELGRVLYVATKQPATWGAALALGGP